MILFSLPNALHISRPLARRKNWSLRSYASKRLADGELYLELRTDVKGKNVTIVGSTSQPDSTLFELLMLINAARENGARTISVIIPYLGYARQDKVSAPGAPVTVKLVAQLLKAAGAKTITLIDIHSDRVRSYFGAAVRAIDVTPIWAKTLPRFARTSALAVSPDHGSAHRARQLAKALQLKDVIVMKKSRPRQNVARVQRIRTNLRGRTALVIDDMIDTGGTLLAAVRELKRAGAGTIIVCATHGIFSKDAISLIRRSPINLLYVADTHPNARGIRGTTIKLISVQPLL